MNNWLTVPLLLPFFSALLLLFWTRPSSWRRLYIGFTLFVQLCFLGVVYALRLVDEPQVVIAGGWIAPFGIALVMDLLSLLFLFFSTITVFASVLFAFAEQPSKKEHPLRYPLLFFLLFGIDLTFLTGDFFNLYVAFEVMLLASYALMTLEASANNLKYAFSYVLMNVVGSFFFLATAGVVYGYFGTLNFTHLAEYAMLPEHAFFVQVVALLSIVVFGLKAAIFPFYFWLPNSYPILPTPLAAIYGGILTKVGVYVLLRLFGTVFPQGLSFTLQVLLISAGFTMLLGVLGAVAQDSIKRILSYHIISQMGFMILAIGFGTTPALAAAIVYTLHNIVVKSSLFLIGGAGASVYQTDRLSEMGHLWGVLPVIGTFFLLQAFSLAGIPPLSGFWGKYLIITEGFVSGQYILIAVAVLTGWLTLYSMIKIWNGAFWRTQKEFKVFPLPHYRGMAGSIGILVAFSLFLGLGAELFIGAATQAAEQLANRKEYSDAIFSQEKESRCSDRSSSIS